jgi:uncharacterized protein (TIGR00661 family)
MLSDFSRPLAEKFANFSRMDCSKNHTILVCPLNWGLGHATRCVPVVKALLARNCRVIIAADGPPLDFLRQEFAGNADFRRFHGNTVRYPLKGNMALKMLLQIPSLLFSIRKEHLVLKRLIKETGASVVISDNRYGLWNKNVKTVFVTHQLFIQAPKGMRWLEPMLGQITRFFVRKYDQCWVPDFPGEQGLSGALSHKGKLSGARFVGQLSRFSGLPVSVFASPLPDDFPTDFFLALISGPEPQRTIFEAMLYGQFLKTGLPVVFVLGKPGSYERNSDVNICVFSHAPTNQIAWLIKNARLVICRPGYSSLMDLAVFGKKALLVPTPGQTEQEYLGSILEKSGQGHCISQNELDIEKDIVRAEVLRGIQAIEINNSLLENALDNLLKET